MKQLHRFKTIRSRVHLEAQLLKLFAISLYSERIVIDQQYSAHRGYNIFPGPNPRPKWGFLFPRAIQIPLGSYCG
jgi:hypothetical protein